MDFLGFLTSIGKTKNTRLFPNYRLQFAAPKMFEGNNTATSLTSSALEVLHFLAI